MKPSIEVYKEALKDLKDAIGKSVINDDGEIISCDIYGTGPIIPVAVYALVVHRIDMNKGGDNHGD